MASSQPVFGTWAESPETDETLVLPRFASLPTPALREKLEKQLKDAQAEVDKLSSRLVYLETTHKNSRDHIEQMLKRGGDT